MIQKELFKMEVGSVIAKSSLFHWEIDMACFEDTTKEDKLLSPIFSFDNFDKWQLTLYPECSSFPYLSLFLTHLSNNAITVRYHLSLLNQDNETVIKKSPGKSKFDTESPSKGFLEFVQQSFIKDPKNKILRNGKLTISCKVVVEEDATYKTESEIQIERSLSRLKEFDKFEKLLSDKEYSDVIIIAEGKSFYLHKNILATSSHVFEAMFRKMVEKHESTVEIYEIKHEVLKELFQYVYTGKVNNIKRIVDQLLSAAEKYCIDGLKALCEETLCNDLYEDNALEYLNLAIINNAEKLKLEAIKSISFDLEYFIEKKEFQDLARLHPKVLIEIMKISM